MKVLPNKIYSVEESIDTSSRLISFEDIQNFIDDVVSSKWWKERSTITKVEAHISSNPVLGSYRKSWMKGVVEIWRPVTKLNLLHELCHIIHWLGETSHSPDHDRKFIKLYYDITKEFLGPVFASRLKNAIIKEKVYGYRVLLKED